LIRRNALLALLAIGCASARVTPDAIDTINQYDAAWLRKDVAGVDAVLAPQFVYFSSTGQVTDRAGTLKLLGSPSYSMTFGKRDDMVPYSSGTTIVVASRWRGEGSYDGKPYVDLQRCSVVVDIAQRKIVSEHCTNMK
jgi:ketosteroid isomerase-like protein